MVSKTTTRKKATRKKTRKKVAGRTANKRKIPGWIILLSGMLFGLAIALFAYINDWVPKPENPNGKPVAQTIQTKSKTEIEDKSADLQIKPKKDYDFYKTLQDMEVVVDKDLFQTDNRTPTTPSNFILQLGAFKNIADAEALKAKVAFIGLTAKIQSVDVNQTRWHRVRIGPFKSGRKADIVLQNLEKNGFDAIIIKQKT